MDLDCRQQKVPKCHTGNNLTSKPQNLPLKLCTTSNKATPTETRPYILIVLLPLGQVFKHMRLWGPYLVNPLQTSLIYVRVPLLLKVRFYVDLYLILAYFQNYVWESRLWEKNQSESSLLRCSIRGSAQTFHPTVSLKGCHHLEFLLLFPGGCIGFPRSLRCCHPE